MENVNTNGMNPSDDPYSTFVVRLREIYRAFLIDSDHANDHEMTIVNSAVDAVIANDPDAAPIIFADLT